MPGLENFSPEIIMGSRASGSRGITDDPIVEETTDEPVPSVAEMVDALYYILMERLDVIEAKLDKLLDA
jgi:hypothetical protein